MAYTEFTLDRPDGISLKGQTYIPEIRKAVVVIVHGMAEHSLRYDRFAEKLRENDLVVYAYDQRGHGRTAGSVEKQGFFAYKNGWQKVVDDLAAVVEKAKKEHPNLPVVIFGHSMGTFVTRNYSEQYRGEAKGIVLSGTTGSAGLLGKVGILLTKFIMLYKKADAPSKLMDKMSFGDFNKAFKPNRTAFDWLSRDEAEVDKYVNDPYCGAVFSIGFYRDMLSGLEAVNTKTHADKIPKGFPIRLFAGDKDPVSKNGKQVKDVYNLYKRVEADVTLKLYPEARHEILNETNREEVMTDIVSVVNEIVKP